MLFRSNVVSRLYECGEGSIRFAGQDLLALPPHRIAGVGIARTFQNLALFPAVSVLDNVLLGGYAFGRTTRARRREALDILDRLGLEAEGHLHVGYLHVEDAHGHRG